MDVLAQPDIPVGEAEEMADKRIAASIQFLQRWAPKGPWVLTALDPYAGPSPARTRAYTPDRLDAMAQWIEGWQDGVDHRNLYFMPNTDRRPPTDIWTKAKKDDIASAVTLHVDLDPYKGEDPEQGRARLLHRLAEDLPAGAPGPPTVIIMSGNGLQALWRLRQPIEVSSGADIQEVEGRNLALAQAFGGDSAFNIDRILRLPWTVNWPDKRKRARGLKPVLSRLISYNPGRLYELEAFPTAKLPAGAVRGAHVAAGTDIRIGDAVSVASLHELDLPLRTKVIITFGEHRGETKPSRSEWLWTAVMSMLRANVPAEIILGIITDPAWAISASVLDKPDPEAYARNQIGRARASQTPSVEHEFDDGD